MHYDVNPRLIFRKPAVCCSALGNAQLICLPDEVVCAVNIALGMNHLKTSTLVQKYFSVLKKNSTFFFERVKIRNSYTILYEKEGVEMFGVIVYFVSVSMNIFGSIQDLDVMPSNPFVLPRLHQQISPVTVSNSILSVFLYNLFCVSVFIYIVMVEKSFYSIYSD